MRQCRQLRRRRERRSDQAHTDLPAGSGQVPPWPERPGDPRRDQFGGDGIWDQPQRLLGWRGRLDAVHAGNVERLRGRCQWGPESRPLQPRRCDLAAANYLRAAGAPGDWHSAVFAYNRDEGYVQDVLADAQKWAAIGSIEGGGALCEANAPNERVARMITEADRLTALRPHTSYVWGGSHGISPTPRDGPFDCSSAVSHLLQVGGTGNPTMTTVAFHAWGKPGAGRWVTILDKPYEPEAHVILRFEPGVTPPEKRYWGTSGFIEGGGHGPGWIPASTFDAAYLFHEERHPPGL